MTAAHVTIDHPGVYDLTDDQYHGDPVPDGSLSSSGARRLLPPSCPAIFHHERMNGRPEKREFDLGHAAHLAVLGSGPELHVVDAANYKTKAAQTERDAAYARGDVPLLPDEFDAVQAMAAAVRAHPVAGGLFGGDGMAEQSLFWVDTETGVWCRARPDWLTPQRVVDYKTTTDVSLPAISRAVERYGYHVQQVFYTAGAAELGLVDPDDFEFWFVFQAKTPPHLVTVVELDEPAVKVGYELMRRALEVYRDCTESGVWPGYSTDIETISLPGWALRAHEREVW